MSMNIINLKMSQNVSNQPTVVKTKLQISSDPDTSYDIFFDIYKYETKEYLYIKLVENTAVAPFYYNRSYTIEDLQKLDRIFLADNMAQVKEDLKDLFEKKMVKLKRDGQSGDLSLELEAMLFAKKRYINFDLIKEMIPDEEKNDSLITLYNVSKSHIKMAKEILSFLQNPNLNINLKILEDLKSNFDIIDNDNDKENDYGFSEFEDEELKQIFSKSKEKTAKLKPLSQYGFNSKKENGYIVEVYFRNKTKKSWPENSFRFVLDSKNSDIQCEEIKYPSYEIGVGTQWFFYLLFDEKIKPESYNLVFDVYFQGAKLKGAQFKLEVTIPD